MFRSKYRFQQPVLRLMFILLSAILALSACAPEDLDYTPTAPPPSPTFTPTPAPQDFVDPKVGRLDAIKPLIPETYFAAQFDWTLVRTVGENGIGTPPPRNLGNGVGMQMTYRTTGGHELKVSFVVFDTPQQAQTQYDIMREIRREQLRVSQPLPALPTPNLVGGNTQFGSEALFIAADVYLVEVFVQNFSSTTGDPRNAVAIASYRIVQEAIARSNLVSTKDARLEALKAVFPPELTIGDVPYALVGRVGDVGNTGEGVGARATYRSSANQSNTVAITVVAFDLVDDTTAYYTQQQRVNIQVPLTLNFAQGSTNSEISGQNQAVASNLSAAAQLIQPADNYFMSIQVNLNDGVAGDLLAPVTQEALNILNAGIAAYESSADAPAATPAPEATSAPTTAPTVAPTTAATPEPSAEPTQTPETRPIG